MVPNTGMDFKSASAGPGGIVIEQFGQIQLYDIKSSTLSPVKISLAGDMAELRPKFVNVARRLTNAHISPTGARALFEARGEILTVPAEKGDPRNLTETTGVMERDPAWSPDGKWIAYFSDESGEYELHVRDSIGLEPAQEDSARRTADVLHDAAMVARQQEDRVHRRAPEYLVRRRRSEEGVASTRIGSWGSNAERAPAWSPDSKWLAYGKRLENYLGAIFVYSLADAKSTQLTDGLSDARYPVFDKDGKYLYFTASTDSGPSLEADIRSASRTRLAKRVPRRAVENRSVAVRAGERRGEAGDAPRRGREAEAPGPRCAGQTPPTAAKPDAPRPRAWPT